VTKMGYIKKEALLSSRIEGTQASLKGVLEFEAKLEPKENINDIREVINYIKAMHHGIDNLVSDNLSPDLINDIHKILIEGTRGTNKLPGKLRDFQNWIGIGGGTVHDAVYVPPPPEYVEELMSELEDFIQTPDNIPSLIKIALIHSQFETIHPYLDGNGRMGRLLITFYLYWKGLLSRPLLYLSFYLKKNRNLYYETLNDIRIKGDWEQWLKFFLKGVIEVSNDSIDTAKRIIELKQNLIEKLLENNVGGVHAVKLIDILFDHPVITVTEISELIGISRQAANKLTSKFEEMNILTEITGKKRYKKYTFVDFVRIIEKGTQI